MVLDNAACVFNYELRLLVGRSRPTSIGVEMTDTKKTRVREWWIWFAASRWYCKDYEPIDEMRPTPNENWKPIHVIEHSAYLAVCKELDEQLLVNGKGQQRELKLMSEVEKLNNQLKVMAVERDQLQTKLKVAKAAIKRAKMYVGCCAHEGSPQAVRESDGSVSYQRPRTPAGEAYDILGQALKELGDE